ncbi:MAG: CcoQ/FixQ family Cbb3-type cytochrome c oxidase assembly chaperone [Chitinophagales bacterium]|nr:CcoQ/FixQ family Cbb3-type cytochrome c oxidase assembly chaperone [Chitinophagales bacterium]
MKLAHYLSNIEGVSIYPIISLLIFVIFFVIVTLRVFRMSDQSVKHIERLPLDDE